MLIPCSNVFSSTSSIMQSGTGGTITTITTYWEKANNHLKITISDDGVGILFIEKERIFEPGYGKGTGLGLFLVREILSITDISILEIGVGREGARFEITIPPGGFRISEEPGDIPPPGKHREN